MKGRPDISVARKDYFNRLHPIAAPVLERIATLDGAFPFVCREIAPRWEDTMGRNMTFHTYDEVVQHAMKNGPSTLQFGGILPISPAIGDCAANPYTMNEATFRTACTANRKNVTDVFGEVVLDVDLSDYNRKGVCMCAPSTCCERCWEVFIEPARAIIHYWLITVFEFAGVVDVFSGGRGFHTWIFDPRLYMWTKDQRATFVQCLDKPLLWEEHTTHIYTKILLPAFERTSEFAGQPTDRESVMERLYLKLDKEVTRNAHHLRKMPLLIHHKTGNVCVPLAPVTSKKKWPLSKFQLQPYEVTNNLMHIFVNCIAKALDEAKNVKK